MNTKFPAFRTTKQPLLVGRRAGMSSRRNARRMSMIGGCFTDIRACWFAAALPGEQKHCGGEKQRRWIRVPASGGSHALVGGVSVETA